MDDLRLTKTVLVGWIKINTGFHRVLSCAETFSLKMDADASDLCTQEGRGVDGFRRYPVVCILTSDAGLFPLFRSELDVDVSVVLCACLRLYWTETRTFTGGIKVWIDFFVRSIPMIPT